MTNGLIHLLHGISAFVHPKLEKLVKEIKELQEDVVSEQEDLQLEDVVNADVEAVAEVSQLADVITADVVTVAKVSVQAVSDVVVVLEAAGAEDLPAPSEEDVLPKQEDIELADVISADVVTVAEVSQLADVVSVDCNG